jgi:hypothetical protein
MDSDSPQTVAAASPQSAPDGSSEHPMDAGSVSAEELSQETNTLTAEERAAKRTQMVVIGVAVAFLVILVAAVVLMAKFPAATVVVRDIAIVFVAVVTFLIGLALIVLLFQLQVLIQVLRDEIQPLLRSVNDTASTLRGTTEFVSHNMVTPIIKASGVLAGVRRVIADAVGVVKATRPRTVAQADTQSNGGKDNG